MEEGSGEGGIRLSKRFSDKDGGEVDYKTKAGTAWSHSFLNQKPWHPLSYPNQRRKWIAEQTHAQRDRRADELAREYAQEQEFLRQTSLLSQKEKEKVDIMQAVSFMYVRPPGYNAESAKAAEVTDERKKLAEHDPTVPSPSSVPQEVAPVREEKKKPRPKDVFGRTLPTEEEFAVLKNAPRLETGVAGRAKPFAVEVRNVKCVRCGNFGHQSGDRECPLKDAIMPNDENRLKRDDPLTAIMAHMDSNEPLKWELKQRPGISPPRGGFMPDDPNQQIVAEEIFDEYGGFLSGGGIPELLTNFPSAKLKKKKSRSKSKHKRRGSSRESDDDNICSDSDGDIDHKRGSKSKSKHKKKGSPTHCVEKDDSSYLENNRHRRSRRKEASHKSKKNKKGSHASLSEDSESDKCHHGKRLASPMRSCEENCSTYDSDRHRRRSKRKEKDLSYSSSSKEFDRGWSHSQRKRRYKHSVQTEHKDSDKLKKTNRKEKDLSYSSSSEDAGRGRSHRKSKYKHSVQTEHQDSDKLRRKNRKEKDLSYSSLSEDSGRGRSDRKSRYKHSVQTEHQESDKLRRKNRKEKDLSYSSSSEDSGRGRSHRKSRYKHSVQPEHQDSDKLRRTNSSPGRWEPRAPRKPGSIDD